MSFWQSFFMNTIKEIVTLCCLLLSLVAFIFVVFIGFVVLLSHWISSIETSPVIDVLLELLVTVLCRRKSIIPFFSTSCFSHVSLFVNNSTNKGFWFCVLISIIIVHWQISDKILNFLKFSFNQIHESSQKYVFKNNLILCVVILFRFKWSLWSCR